MKIKLHGLQILGVALMVVNAISLVFNAVTGNLSVVLHAENLGMTILLTAAYWISYLFIAIFGLIFFLIGRKLSMKRINQESK